MKYNKKLLVPYEEVLAEELRDPSFRVVWEAEEAKRKVISTLIGQRIKRKLTQAQLAHRAGIKQPSLARVESGSVMPSLSLLNKLAKALNSSLEIRFIGA